ncbi:conserved domain protein [Bacteroides xylanisolvens SD CC 2a]|uniref:hypothetical protein n=1 Tax=Bacteroides xylanisolvens TaxID=371601 RepID=UPI0001CEF3CD|nr:hypothetical protein [Bacteroides xylanisolvens]EFF58231.1 conserved domain protein [Bacteroides xylanisolvens SD CC 2a]
MNSSIFEQRSRFAMIGALMVIISLLFLFYMGSSLVSSTKKISGADTRDRDHLYRHRRIKTSNRKVG